MAYLSGTNPVTHVRRLRAANAPAARIATAKAQADAWVAAGKPDNWNGAIADDENFGLPMIAGISGTTLAIGAAVAAFFFFRKRRG